MGTEIASGGAVTAWVEQVDRRLAELEVRVESLYTATQNLAEGLAHTRGELQVVRLAVERAGDATSGVASAPPPRPPEASAAVEEFGRATDVRIRSLQERVGVCEARILKLEQAGNENRAEEIGT